MPGKNGGPFGFGTSLLDDSDVQVLNPSDGQILTYSAALGKWINGNSGGGALAQIGTQTLSGSQASISFASIPGTYSHLLLFLYGRTDKAASDYAAAAVRFNGDTGTNYEWAEFTSVGTGSSAGGSTGNAFARLGYITGAGSVAGHASALQVSIPAYTGTTFHKTIATYQYHPSADWRVAIHGGAWHNTAAITSITIIEESGANFIAGTVATLYGIT